MNVKVDPPANRPAPQQPQQAAPAQPPAAPGQQPPAPRPQQRPAAAPNVEPLKPAHATQVASSPEELAPVRTAQQWRRLLVKLSFIPCVLLPALLGVLYFGLIAADRFAVETKFSIRMVSGTPSTDLLGSLTGFSSSGSTITDSYILIDFIESREIIDKLEERMDLRAVYAHEEADFLKGFDAEETVEDFRDYLDGMITVYFDSSSQIITMEVQAFTPQDAQKVSAEILKLSEELVNELSEKARRDTLQNAQAEVARMEDRLRKNRAQMRDFRDEEQDVDPAKTAEGQITFLSNIEASLSTARAELENLLRFMQEDAPRVKVLKSRIKALEDQAAQERARLGVDKSTDGEKSTETLSAKLESYEVLALEQEFSQKAYVSALTSLELARAEANRQQRYLSAFVKPSLPQEALYPERLLNMVITLIAALLAWGIGVMMVYIVREHSQ